MLDTPAPSPDRPLAAVLDGMLRVFDRVTAAIAADGIDPRLVQSATSAANAIVRIVQAQARLADPDAELEAEIMRARAELGLLPDLDPHHDPRAAGAPDHAVYPGPGVMPAAAAGLALWHAERSEESVPPALTPTKREEADPSLRLWMTVNEDGCRTSESAWRPAEAAAEEAPDAAIARTPHSPFPAEARREQVARARGHRDPPHVPGPAT